MKQSADLYTRDLLERPKRGRPRKPDALTPAERARRYRANKREAKEFLEGMSLAVGHVGEPVFSGLPIALQRRLQAAGIFTDDDLADTFVEELVEKLQLREPQARDLIVRARATWGLQS